MRRVILTVMAFVLFAGLGYIYYLLIGCNGTCAIASSPYLSVAWGGAVGALLGSALSERRQEDADL